LELLVRLLIELLLALRGAERCAGRRAFALVLPFDASRKFERARPMAIGGALVCEVLDTRSAASCYSGAERQRGDTLQHSHLFFPYVSVAIIPAINHTRSANPEQRCANSRAVSLVMLEHCSLGFMVGATLSASRISASNPSSS
jgi:hypothetical protein